MWWLSIVIQEGRIMELTTGEKEQKRESRYQMFIRILLIASSLSSSSSSSSSSSPWTMRQSNLILVTLFLALHGWMSLVGLSSMSILGLSSMSSIGFCSWSITPWGLVGGLADQKFSFLKISHHMLMSESEKKNWVGKK